MKRDAAVVHLTVLLMGAVRLGRRSTIDAYVTVGAGSPRGGGVVIGPDAFVRSHSILYSGVRAGARFRTGHRVLVREWTVLGNDVLVGTDSIIEGHVTIGSRVSIQSRVFIPTQTRIGNDVFIGPGATLTNDRYPVRRRARLRGPVVEDGVSIGAAAVILPGIVIGRGSFVAAGAVVTKDVPPGSLAVGVPARTAPLPKRLAGPNRIAKRAARER